MPESKRFLLRLDPRLFEALRRWASDDLRSINAQIEYILTEQVRKAGRLPHQPRRHRTGETGEGSEPSDDDDDDSIDSEEPAASTRR
ncbi:MAG TPA: hypothetical protein VHV28_09590 [Solirubrobacteraceae bacterium]|jgi:hypothetical protein|nr:hypothetical protein [Solirubrobacteraceae bacterium]